jgi:tripartite-type tricarboxylate transporter receptor subunit TctC
MAVSAWSAPATWPDKPVHIIVPYAAGGTTDYAARQVAQKLSDALGQSFYVENKTGASGTIGTQFVARSTPDGSTLLTNDTAYTMLPAVFAHLPWDHAKDLVPVTTLLRAPVVLCVPASSPFKTLKDLLAYAKQNPGKLNFGSGGAGSSAHLQAELFKSEAKISLTHIPYRGAGEAMLGLVGNQVDMLITAAPTAIPQLKGGRVRALAVTGAQRVPVLADVPTFAEAGLPSYAIDNWFGIAAPKGTPPAVIDKLYHAIAQVLADPALKARFAEQGAFPGGLPPADFAALIASQTKLFTHAAEVAGLRPE